MNEVTKKDPQVLAAETALVPAEEKVERLQGLEDLIMSIYYRNQEVRKIFAFNISRGVRLEEMGPYEAPMDYKLNQIEYELMRLRRIFGLTEEACNTQTNRSPNGGRLSQDSKRLNYSKKS